MHLSLLCVLSHVCAAGVLVLFHRAVLQVATLLRMLLEEAHDRADTAANNKHVCRWPRC